MGDEEVRLLSGHLIAHGVSGATASTERGILGMTRFISDNQQELDAEWVELMLSARSKGLTTDEVSKVLRILQEQGQTIIKENAV
jgi:hypothetical protein